MTASRQTATDPVQAGKEALARGEWEEARGLFEAALERGDSAEAWEGLGWAGWWLSDAELTFGARQRAYRAYRAGGAPASAGRVAAWLAADYLEYAASSQRGSAGHDQPRPDRPNQAAFPPARRPLRA